MSPKLGDPRSPIPYSKHHTVLRWMGLVEQIAPSRDKWLILAVIGAESGGDPCAGRVERGFWARYRAGTVVDLHKAGLGHWEQYPDVVSASYGLMQVMVPTAIEAGITLTYPWSLCDPTTGIRAGVAVLEKCFSRVEKDDKEPIRAALLHYNGGGDSLYPDRVLAWRTDLMLAANPDVSPV